MNKAKLRKRLHDSFIRKYLRKHSRLANIHSLSKFNLYAKAWDWGLWR